MAQQARRGQFLGSLIAGLMAEDAASLRALGEERLGPVKRRFREVAQRVQPGLGAAEAEERFEYAAGAMAHVLAHQWIGHADSLDEEALTQRLHRLVDFLAAGFQAPPNALPEAAGVEAAGVEPPRTAIASQGAPAPTSMERGAA